MILPLIKLPFNRKLEQRLTNKEYSINNSFCNINFVIVQSLSCVQLFVTPWNRMESPEINSTQIQKNDFGQSAKAVQPRTDSIFNKWGATLVAECEL